MAKACFNLHTTRALIDRLRADRALRNLCGWVDIGKLPSESTFSRAFDEFSRTSLPDRIHEAVIKKHMGDRLVGHICRDSTAICAREKPVPKPRAEEKPRKKRGRLRKGEVRVKEPTHLEKQMTMSFEELLADVPCKCNVSGKTNAKGKHEYWIGYKLHIDAADGGILISCQLSSASVHDSQLSILLGEMTARRVTGLYMTADAADDSDVVRQHCKSLGTVPIIDRNPRNDKALRQRLKEEAKATRCIGHITPEKRRYKERTTVERVNGRLKDEFGGRHVRVRGGRKVNCHLMFGILALTVDPLLRLLNECLPGHSLPERLPSPRRGGSMA